LYQGVACKTRHGANHGDDGVRESYVRRMAGVKPMGVIHPRGKGSSTPTALHHRWPGQERADRLAT
jgi:hypothetical protein